MIEHWELQHAGIGLEALLREYDVKPLMEPRFEGGTVDYCHAQPERHVARIASTRKLGGGMVQSRVVCTLCGQRGVIVPYRETDSTPRVGEVAIWTPDGLGGEH